jgi:hypothetical protein
MMLAPDSLSYHVVFDISRRGPQSLWVLIIPFGMAVYNYALTREYNPRRRQVDEIMTGFIGLIGAIFTIGILGQYVELRVALARGNYQLVEGVVTDFVPGGDHRSERFTVVIPRGQYVYQYRYEYSPSNITQGFNQTRPDGGPIREGLRVRIADVHGKIARLEIARCRIPCR